MFKIQVPEVLDNKLDITFLLFYWWEVSQSHADHRPVHWTLSINAQNKNKKVYVLDTFFYIFPGENASLQTPPPPNPRWVMAERGITLDGYVVERFTLYQMSNMRALSKAFFILPYLNVVSLNIFQLGGLFWGLVVVKLS